jgi:hypothetical protein
MLGRLQLAVGSAAIDDIIRYELRLGVSVTRFETLLFHGHLPAGCYRLVTARIMSLLGVRELTIAESRRLITERIARVTGHGSIEEYKAACQAGAVDRSRSPVVDLEIDLGGLRGMLYVIGEPGSGVVKIGQSLNVGKRLRQLQFASPQPLAVRYAAPGAADWERTVHEHFTDRRLHGEWFDFTGADPVRAVRDGLLAVDGMESLAALDQARARAAASPATHDAQARAMIRAALEAEAARLNAPRAAGLDEQAKKALFARLSAP